jgi:hypothetical protein
MSNETNSNKSYQSVAFGDEIIRDRVLAAKEELIRDGVISETIGDRIEKKIEQNRDLGIKIRVPKDLLTAKLVKIEQVDDFTWTNTLFEILLSVSTCFLGALLGYLLTASKFDLIAILLTIFSVILIGLTIFLLARRNILMKRMVQEENFVSLIENEFKIV